ncbi:hypothetical protein [Priestia koreensis]|uniref:hypothetical protein n=1 Tax=Priestia koreensis TaxID=284581 RepID=UPI001F5AD745|nr:hypothetical protein [Priestia koreensis]UNL83173.1 hypothetical protein IE339_13325 [Priestia koreensis]
MTLPVVLFFIIPILGVLWFVNLTLFLKKLHAKEDTHNTVMIGGLLTFAFVFFVEFGFISM